jgi:hypothetical protein
MSYMKTHLLIGFLNGEMKSTHVCPRVNLNIKGINFQADLVVLTYSGLDVILGMDWLGECDTIILCATKSVLLTSPKEIELRLLLLPYPKKKAKCTKIKESR